MSYRHYTAPEHKIVSVKPWVIPMLKEMAENDRVPQVKVLTDAVTDRYKRYKKR